MAFRLASLIAAMTLGAASLAAAAESVPTNPPQPTGASKEAVEQWISSYVVFGRYVASTATESEAMAFDPYGMELAPDGVRATVRGELFRQTALPEGAIRSYRNRVAVNCSGRRLLILSRQGYPQSNLQGDSVQIDASKEAWSEPYAPASPQGALIRQICSVGSLYRGGVNLADALPPSPDRFTDDATREWLERNVVPTGERLVFAHAGVGAYLAPALATKSAEGRPVVWLHTELAMLIAADETAWRSMKEHVELDCAGRRYRDIEENVYPGSNLTGDAFMAPVDTGWTQAAPGSNDLGWLTGACAALATPAAAGSQPSSIR